MSLIRRCLRGADRPTGEYYRTVPGGRVPIVSAAAATPSSHSHSMPTQTTQLSLTPTSAGKLSPALRTSSGRIKRTFVLLPPEGDGTPEPNPHDPAAAATVIATATAAAPAAGGGGGAQPYSTSLNDAVTAAATAAPASAPAPPPAATPVNRAVEIAPVPPPESGGSHGPQEVQGEEAPSAGGGGGGGSSAFVITLQSGAKLPLGPRGRGQGGGSRLPRSEQQRQVRATHWHLDCLESKMSFGRPILTGIYVRRPFFESREIANPSSGAWPRARRRAPSERQKGRRAARPRLRPKTAAALLPRTKRESSSSSRANQPSQSKWARRPHLS